MKTKLIRLTCFLTALLALTTVAHAQVTGFTYQGQLNDGANMASGIYDLRFTVYDSSGGPGVVAGPLTNSPTSVSNGLFTVTLDFGAGVFTGADRWLEIGVRTNGGGAFTGLTPRQPLTASPYAIHAANAATAATATTAGTVGANAVATTGLQASSVTSAKIADGTVTAADVNAASFNTTFWRTVGNAGTTPGMHFLGTSDNQPLELKVNGTRALRLESTLNDLNFSGIVNVVGGSPTNSVGVGILGATIGGGGAAHYVGSVLPNSVDANFATLCGGAKNTIQSGATAATIGGGQGNTIQSNAFYSTIAGGMLNTNKTWSSESTIGGGNHNTIQANASHTTIAGGSYNTILANGSYGTIPGGRENAATNYAFAAGHRAKANHTGAFVWADSQDADHASTAANQFLIRAAGGVGIGTTAPAAPLHVQSGSVGVGLNFRTVLGLERAGDTFLQVLTTTSNYAALVFGSPSDGLDASVRYNAWGGRDLSFRTLNSTRMIILTNGNVGIGNTGPSDRLTVVNARCDGSSWINASDRNLKQNFAPVDARAVLEKVAALPVQQWSYQAQPGEKHVGPVAQDFRAAFGLGADDTSIATVDADGVALAAIQGLNQKTEDRSQKAEGRIQKLEAENAELKSRLEKLERLMDKINGGTK